MTKTVVIIGAGIVGVSTALWLQREDHDVILVDKQGPGDGASYGNGGVLASCSIVPVTGPSLIAKAPRLLLDRDGPLFLRWAYLPKLSPWLCRYLSHANAADTRRISNALKEIIGDSLADHQALAQGTRAEKLIVPADYLYAYDSRAHYEADAFSWELRREAGFTWRELESPEFRKYDPAFADSFGFAICLPGHGRIADPGAYVKDLAAEVDASGGRILQAEVTDILYRNGQVTGVRAGGETIPCDAAVLTAGAWSGPLARKLGLKVPLESERGYHLEFHNPNIMPKSPTMIAGGKFVLTPMEGRLRAAGIVEFGGLNAPPSRKPFDLLFRNVKAALPGLSWSKMTEWMGHRPATTDSIPVIGEVPGVQGAYVGFGHHHVGLTGGPRTGRILAQLVSGQKTNIDVAPFSPARFSKTVS